MITEKPVSLQEHAMRYGTMMGIYWIIKFIFFPLGFRIPLLQLLFVVLTVFVPILGYIYARKFRNEQCRGTISFFKAYTFTFFMYTFATILASVAHYVYFRFIDHGFLFHTYQTQLQQIKEASPATLGMSIDQLLQTFEAIAALSPLQLTFQLVSQNIFYGILMALPTAFLIMKQKK